MTLRAGPFRPAAEAVAVLAFLVTVVLFAHDAVRLARYPWDWAPDEGLALDYARRVSEAPATLYGRELVPFPVAYTPLLPLLLAPLVRAFEEPLLSARLLAMAWTLVVAVAIGVLVRRRGTLPLALACVALVLAAGDLSIWFLLVRVDGLMIALWLAAAVVLLPARLEVGADRLRAVRLWTGSVLLVAAVLAKPTAAVHGAPLVVGWLLVDRKSGWRLVLAVTALGLLALAVLQAATDGGFLWVMRLWGIHPQHPGLLGKLTRDFAVTNAAYLALAAAGTVAAWRKGAMPHRDAAWLLVIGGLLGILGLGKAGAWLNYLLPAFCAIIIAAGRLWGSAGGSASALGSALAGTLALVSLGTRALPLPSAADEATSRAFYAAVQARGGPLLATRPDYAYYVLRQPIEAEGSSLLYLVAARVPGTEVIKDRVQGSRYRLIVAIWYFWPRAFRQALEDRYSIVAACELRFFYGLTEFVLFVPKGERASFVPPIAGRCRAIR